MTRLDVHAWIGAYPWRHLPSYDAAALRDALALEGFDGAWVGHLPSAWWRDPAQGNRELVQALKPHAAVLHPAPCIRPDWPRWRDELTFALDHGARAIRAYPMQWGLGPEHPAWLELGHAVAEAGVVLVLTQRFEDLRQRHPLDTAADLTAAHVRALARETSARVIVGAASRALIEETHFGLTVSEQHRVWYDVAWLWGPPDDEFALMIETIGTERLVEGTGWPLRLAEQLRCARDLLPARVRSVRLTSAEAVITAARERP